MKKINTIFALLGIVAVLTMPVLGRAQTLTINSISATHFCAGDPVSVTFTATGTWVHKNAFTFQLSDTGGSFLTTGFTKLGSVIDTVSGTFTIVSTIPPDAMYSDRYRFRIMAANPYTVSADNGTDITIGEFPFHFILNGASVAHSITAVIDHYVGFDIMKDPNYETADISDTLFWDFGAGSNPSSAIGRGPMDFSKGTTYSTPGLKTMIVRSVGPGGCSSADTLFITVLDCTDPVIPHDAFIVNADRNLNTAPNSQDTTHDSTGTGGGVDLRQNRAIWVNPGVTVSGGIDDTIFAEAGATVSGGANIVYLKPGASYTGSGSLVIYASGASVSADASSHECSGLTFDYSTAPPNSIMRAKGVVEPDIALAAIELTPNPTEGMISVQGAPNMASITVMNLLGERVMELTPRSTNFTIDLSKQPAGTYYIRFASNQSVVTKKIVKE